jgi:hypothetical protein
MLNLDKKQFLNILPCDGEIGSSTKMAAGGKYFSKNVPIEGYCKEFGLNCAPGNPILGLADGVEVMTLNARDKDGDVIDHSLGINDAVQKCEKEDIVPIMHSIKASSTGIEAKTDYDL